ncbi:MAG: polyprenyl synthetase family protein [Candidatus Hydrogenedentes bacterium]|nr:polyprenyl synthetase family protein [Candidatus Hydrogenedentota bacterium]
MTAPLRIADERPAAPAAPLRVRAHLLHRLRAELSPAALRAQTSAAGTALPRMYWQKALGAPLQDFLDRNSKMFRASMTEWAWRAAGGAGEMPMAFALAVEAMHAGSLIIDDIEDGATERRGDVALHLRYGVAPALNAGNWLYFWPARLIGEAGLRPDQELAALKKLAETQHRCHLGQGLDVSLKVQDIHQEDMPAVTATKTALKTGALMGLSAWLGALAAGADLETCEAYAAFGEELGGMLQILDDAGSMASGARAEKAREDLLTGAPTWPWAWAAQTLDPAAYRELVHLSQDVQGGRAETSFLRGRLRDVLPESLDADLHARLAHALTHLDNRIANPACVDALHREFERLRNSYV